MVDRDDFDRIYNRSSTQRRFYNVLYGSFRAEDERHPQEMLDLLFRCLSPDPEDRPSIDEIMSCQWIATAPEEVDEGLKKELETLYSLERHPDDQ
jgi:serine/threonine protein kinase